MGSDKNEKEILNIVKEDVKLSLFSDYMIVYRALLMAQTIKNLPAMQETWVQSRVGKIRWRREWQPTPVLLPGESPRTEKPGGLTVHWITKSLPQLK